MSNTWSPLKIEVLLHYGYSPTLFPRRNMAVKMIEKELFCAAFIQASRDATYYELTPRGEQLFSRLKTAAYRIAERISKANPAAAGGGGGMRKANYRITTGRVSFPDGPFASGGYIDPTRDLYAESIRRGGFVPSMIFSAPFGKPTKTVEQAIADARERLMGLGMKSFTIHSPAHPDGVTVKTYAEFTDAMRKAHASAQASARAATKPKRPPYGSPEWVAMYGALDPEDQPATPATPPPLPYHADPAWIARYDRFKRLGSAFVNAGDLSNVRWKHVFDIIFARTDRLRNVALSVAICNELEDHFLGDANFDSVRKIALEALPK